MVESSCPHVAVAWLQQTTPAFIAEGEALNIMERLTDVFVIKIKYYNYYKEENDHHVPLESSKIQFIIYIQVLVILTSSLIS